MFSDIFCVRAFVFPGKQSAGQSTEIWLGVW